jgi:hypothetical protein
VIRIFKAGQNTQRIIVPVDEEEVEGEDEEEKL